MTKKMNFSAILDKNYITRLNTLLYSLFKYDSKFNFYVVALDDETYIHFKNKKNCIPISIKEIHKFYPELDNIEKERDRVSYIFTLSPFFPSYILENFPNLDHICSLDSDQFFFSSPKVIFDLLENYSVLITPHRFSPRLQALNFERFGRFNVSFQVFKRDQIGLQCLKLWREQCLNWCFDKEENGWYADQKYLNSWKGQFGEKIHEIGHLGLGLAPWNIEKYSIIRKKNVFYVDGDLLILFHYQGLRFLENNIIYTYLDHYIENVDISNYKKLYKNVVKSMYLFGINVDSLTRKCFDKKFIYKNQKYCFKYRNKMLFRLDEYNDFVYFRFLKSISKVKDWIKLKINSK